MKAIELIEGQPYMVKQRGGAILTRRVYRGKEMGVLGIERYVFSAKVKKGVYAIVTSLENGVRFFHWKNTQTAPSQEISIPYYDILEIKHTTT